MTVPLDSPYHHEEDAKMERCILRSLIARVLVILGAVLALGMLLATLGCAAQQQASAYCPRFTVMAMQDNSGDTLYILDAENLHKLAVTLQGLDKGTCKIEPRGGV